MMKNLMLTLVIFFGSTLAQAQSLGKPIVTLSSLLNEYSTQPPNFTDKSWPPKSEHKIPAGAGDDLLPPEWNDRNINFNGAIERPPRVIGGGGSFVRFPEGQLKFWDLFFFSQDWTSEDARPGDYIRFNQEELAVKGKWLDHRKLSSFKFLKKRLELWKGKYKQIG
ncbi:MAG: hypothetical protein AB7O96_16700, partial [Pseudobdellovibrionaceae bacterium]